MKVCYISHHFSSPEVLLKDIIKMTPKKSGKWKDMEAVTNPFEADVVILLDGHSNINYPEDRAYYFGQHPYGCSAFKSLADKPLNRKFPNSEHLNPGEWWVSFDYDYLNTLPPPKKNKELVAISTYYVNHKPTYTHRIQFLEELSKIKELDIYGRQEENFKSNPYISKYYKGVVGIKNFNPLLGEHIVGKEILLDYNYSVEMDIGNDNDGKPLKNYFSERFYDSLLCWCFPFYFGSDNVEDYLPRNAFCYIDITTEENRKKSAEIVKTCIQEQYRDKNIEAIAEARNLLLNRYQLWAYTYQKIRSL
jgi:hypothetical protein